MNSLIITN